MLYGEAQFAGFWRRAAAMALDSSFFSVLLGLLLGFHYVSADYLSSEGLISSVLSLIITVGLWVAFLGTPGKLLLDCQVVDADSFSPISLKQAIYRYLGYFVSLLPLGLGFMWIAWDERKQGFHDKIANTVVLHDAGIEHRDESQKNLLQLMSEIR